MKKDWTCVSPALIDTQVFGESLMSHPDGREKYDEDG